MLDDLHAATPRERTARTGSGAASTPSAGRRRLRKTVAAAFTRRARARRRSSDVCTFHAVQQRFDRMTAREWLATRVPGGLDTPLARCWPTRTSKSSARSSTKHARHRHRSLARVAARCISPYEESDQRYHIRCGNDLIVQRLPRRSATASRPHAARRPFAASGRFAIASRSRERGAARRRRGPCRSRRPFTLLREVDLGESGFRARKLRAISGSAWGGHEACSCKFRDRAWVAQGGNGEHASKRLPRGLVRHARAIGRAVDPELLFRRRDCGQRR